MKTIILGLLSLIFLSSCQTIHEFKPGAYTQKVSKEKQTAAPFAYEFYEDNTAQFTLMISTSASFVGDYEMKGNDIILTHSDHPKLTLTFKNLGDDKIQLVKAETDETNPDLENSIKTYNLPLDYYLEEGKSFFRP